MLILFKNLWQTLDNDLEDLNICYIHYTYLLISVRRQSNPQLVHFVFCFFGCGLRSADCSTQHTNEVISFFLKKKDFTQLKMHGWAKLIK